MFLVILAAIYKNWAPVLGFFALLDLCSHWSISYSAALKDSSHKNCQNPILKFYYNQIILALCCAGNEATLICFYILHFNSTGLIAPVMGQIAKILLLFFAPIAAFKQFVNVIQWYEAFLVLSEYDLQHKKKSN
jgi:hypothetical protein